MSGFSDFVNKNQPVVGGIAAVVLIGVLVYIVGFGGGKKQPNQLWFYDLQEQTLVSMSRESLPPVTLSNGNTAVHAYVFQCTEGGKPSGDLEVAYVRRFSDEAAQAMKDIEETGGPATAAQVQALTKPSAEVVATLPMLEAGEWVPIESPHGKKIAMSVGESCPGGEFVYAMP